MRIAKFVLLIVAGFCALAAGLGWLFQPEPETSSGLKYRMERKAADIFSIIASADSLVGQSSVFTKTRFRHYWTLDSERHLQYYNVLNPKGIRSDTSFFLKDEDCGITAEGKLDVTNAIDENLLVVYTRPAGVEEVIVKELVNPRSYWEKVRTKSEDQHCPNGTLISMTVVEFQQLRQEWYLREHADHDVEVLAEKEHIERQQKFDTAIEKALQKVEKESQK